jgi:hypothetical protein
VGQGFSPADERESHVGQGFSPADSSRMWGRASALLTSGSRMWGRASALLTSSRNQLPVQKSMVKVVGRPEADSRLNAKP